MLAVDYFRHHDGLSPPLACFLSHVHSDHLSGLETLRSPFVYCSAATREILLRLERYPCRINYSKGILEARQQTYKHLSKKPLPLETPTIIELQPGINLQVTLFDANHCPGSSMFLIEGHGKAILYTGDVRCEPWFVNTIARNPTLIEYTCGIKALDTIYLDTSFTDDIPFQTKAEGIAELLRKVAQYPKDTIFYIQSWTYGYEDVWIALSKALNSPIHVDDYKLRIFSSIAPALSGFMCGNSLQPGCLTENKNVRLHSCESGNMCSIARQSSVVRIQPVVASFSDGKVIHEAGIGGGGEDLEREMELGVASTSDLHNLLEIIDALKNTTEEARTECARLLTNALASGRNLQLNIREDIYLTDLRKAILPIANQRLKAGSSLTGIEDHGEHELSKVIRFPYSRHSSYPELCNLVNAFRPKDIWPCTFHLESWREKAISIESLFGRYCSGDIFAHDIKVNNLTKQNIQTISDEPDTQRHESCSPSVSSPTGQVPLRALHTFRLKDVNLTSERDSSSLQRQSSGSRGYKDPNAEKLVKPFEEQVEGASLLIQEWLSQCHTGDDDAEDENDSQNTTTSLTPMLSIRHSPARLDAYRSMLQNCRGTEWNSIELISTGCNHSAIEQEL
ncbi:beta-lactamase-like protein [Trichoderma asperelloides]|nr:beta-lactamase-like protein [Trichoderma asperelloides]